MANEGTVKHTRTVVKDGVTHTWNESDRFDVSGTPVSAGIQTIGTTAEVLDVGDVGTVGRVAFKNLDDENFVDWGPDSGGTQIDCGRLLPGETAEFRLKPGVSLKLKADTAACEVKFELLSN